MDNLKEIIGITGYVIESTGVLVIIVGFIASTLLFLKSFRGKTDNTPPYMDYRRNLGKTIILGLEFLIAGDIIRTVVVADTLTNVSVLALIILIRTFLVFTLHLEVENRWPWKPAK